MTESEIHEQVAKFADEGKIDAHHIGPFTGILLKLQHAGVDIGKAILAPIAAVVAIGSGVSTGVHEGKTEI